MRWSWLLCVGCTELDRTFVLTLEPGVWDCEQGMRKEVLPLIDEPLLQEGEHEIRLVRDQGFHLLLRGRDFEGDRLGGPLSSLSLWFPLVRSSQDTRGRRAWMRETLSIHRADEDEPRPSYRLSQHREVPASGCRQPPCPEIVECEWQAEATLVEGSVSAL